MTPPAITPVVPGRTADGSFLSTRPLRDSLLGDLLWRGHGAFARELVLEAGSERIAVVRWKRWYSFEAVAESADGRWLLGRRRASSLRGNPVVRDAATREEVAGLQRGWRGTGVLRFASGVEFGWEREGFWRPRYSWTTGDGRTLLGFRVLFGFRPRFEMTVDPAAREREELPVLVVLGAYVMALDAAQRRGG